MSDFSPTIADELGLRRRQVLAALKLFAEGGTVPFVARYRKEQTGGLDEIQLRAIQDRHTYLAELADRKATILKSIDEQGQLTDALRRRIEATTQKAELEDLYLPYRPKRRTRATVARERGLEPLADWLAAHNAPDAAPADLQAEAARYIDPEREVATAEDALQGASDILAEGVAERAELRAWVRKHLFDHGAFVSEIKADHPEGTTQYEMYRSYRVPVKHIKAHNMLALRRGEEEGLLIVDVAFDEDAVVAYLNRQVIRTDGPVLRPFLEAMVADAFQRLMRTTLIGDVRLQKKQEADEASIETFAKNLRELLLASPAGMRPTLGIDPGFRTGCKLAILDRTGRFLEHHTIYPHTGGLKRANALDTVIDCIQRHGIELIAIGNATAGRETDQFIGEVLKDELLRDVDPKPTKVLVSEAGASVYSASEVAIEEFPDLDLTVRGAISIGRRLQDPLAELVKIDPKSIGVGQYQHDVDQGLLKKKLEETVESCVNYVGVDLNTASAALLSYVAGIGPSTAKNVVAHRDAHDVFGRREALLDVTRFGPKTFEQAAGFLRIRDGANPLDNTAVHPESYPVVEAMAADLGVPVAQITEVPERLGRLDLKRYVTDTVGEPTLRDILDELKKPGRDPREEFSYATFRADVTTLHDLEPGMMLEGVVTNVANFGAFVDIGVKRDGLVHISQLADRYVKDPLEVVKVGEVVTVRVVKVDEKLKRISLSMRSEEAPKRSKKRKAKATPTSKRKKGTTSKRGGSASSGKAPSGKAPSGKAPSGKAPSGKAPSGKQDAPKQASGKAGSSRRGKKKDEGRYTVDDLVKKFNQR